jgi:DNA-directed RNA polymerase specialized sigma24 family protein
MSNTDPSSSHQPGLRRRPEFTATSWTAVAKAGDPTRPDAQAALEHLCNAYWYPLYAYVRRRGYDPHNAEDLTQEFFFRLVRDNYLRVADRERGRFRTFLLSAMMHFLSNERARAQAAKRGGGKQLVSLDEELAEARYLKDVIADPSAVKMFERGWANTLLDQVREALRQEYEAAGKEAVFSALQDYLRDETESGDYTTAGAQLNMRPGAVAVAVHRLRQRYADLLRSAIAQTLLDPTPANIEVELGHLMAALS